MLKGIRTGLLVQLLATSVSFDAFLDADPLNANAYLVGISAAIAIPFILIAFLVERFDLAWLQFRHFWLKIVALTILRILGRIKVLGDFFRPRWDNIAESAIDYRRNYERNVNKLLSKDETEQHDEFHHVLTKRVRRLEQTEQLSSILEDWEEWEDSDNDDI